MQNTTPTTASKPITIQLNIRPGRDGTTEIFIDVFGGYNVRDQLKAEKFRFVKNCSAGMGPAANLDKDGNRKMASVWRKFLIAAEPDGCTTHGVQLIDDAIAYINTLRDGPLKGARISGARSVAIQLIGYWKSTEGIHAARDRLYALETPWQSFTGNTRTQKVA